jgi:hypothetical protein
MAAKRKKTTRRKYEAVAVANVSPAAWKWAANIVKRLWPKLTVVVSPTAASAPSGAAPKVHTHPVTRAPGP